MTVKLKGIGELRKKKTEKKFWQPLKKTIKQMLLATFSPKTGVTSREDDRLARSSGRKKSAATSTDDETTSPFPLTAYKTLRRSGNGNSGSSNGSGHGRGCGFSVCVCVCAVSAIVDFTR